MTINMDINGEPHDMDHDQGPYENASIIIPKDQHHCEAMTENLLREIIRKEDSDDFEKDFKEFLTGVQIPCKVAMKANNKDSNRYKNIIPYDHSRVQLGGCQNYINANFIKNLDNKNAYVATQGPKLGTLGDFWTMVWQLKTGKIVMLANCVELEKPKVSQYWPEDASSIEHGDMKISFISLKQYAAYTIRELRLEKENAEEKRVISQFHFTKWPDHGTPDVMHFALLLRHVECINSKLSGPIVVHCSAGVGRTGTYIAVDALFKHGKDVGVVDPPAFINSMRQDRMDMVQTKVQYEFIYHALVELFLTENTTVPMGDLLQEYRKLDDKRPTLLTGQLSEGMMPENQGKNRDLKILPGNKNRPFLSSQPTNRTDYINAVFLPSVQNYEGYIATQWPLPDTAGDFWAMIYDYKSTAVVILDSDADVDDPSLMPSQESEITGGLFSVQTASRSCSEGSIVMTEVYLSKAGNDTSHKLKILRMCDWPYDKQTCSEGYITQMVYAVQGWQKQATFAGPVTVVCRNGSSKCGIFCTVANAIENINLNQRTSLIQVVRQLQLRCPSFIGTYESYVACNQEVILHLNSLSEN
ncbi:receptor-type tyrosine-protein phosphatase alpha-like [Pecten maximus]|uniref:receptor-type tyrosine-protein phosphatase alpha-like n=1 Tax=Pecten maximus TaxID=6579 RepID=UPI0014587DB9|nr:receptor-type tyrosine-protein phosphatase alpha-like [Pecten maximus]